MNTELYIIEDSDDDFIAIKRALNKANVECGVKRFDQAEDVLERLEEGCKLPSLILLDLNLPGIDGLELLKILKKDVRYQFIPVVIFTTSNNKKDIEASYALGANAYMVKPIRLEDFVKTMSSFVNYWLRTAVIINLETTVGS